MKLYSIVITARRVIDDQVEIRVHPFLILHETTDMVIEEAKEIAAHILPPEEGWGEYSVIAMEIVQGMSFDDGSRLTWSIEKPRQDTEVPNG